MSITKHAKALDTCYSTIVGIVDVYCGRHYSCFCICYVADSLSLAELPTVYFDIHSPVEHPECRSVNLAGYTDCSQRDFFSWEQTAQPIVPGLGASLLVLWRE